MQRVLEPELMEDEAQVAAYARADFSDSNRWFVESLLGAFPRSQAQSSRSRLRTGRHRNSSGTGQHMAFDGGRRFGGNAKCGAHGGQGGWVPASRQASAVPISELTASGGLVRRRDLKRYVAPSREPGSALARGEAARQTGRRDFRDGSGSPSRRKRRRGTSSSALRDASILF
jgi:hypothetical protein